MAALSYKKLALQWQPSQRKDRVFYFVAITAVVVAIVLGLWLSSIEVPEKSRNQKTVVPERVAKFITQKEKPKPPPPKPKPKPPAPKPEPKLEPKPEKPVIDRKRPEQNRKPLTDEQIKARENAQKSGLLALSSELNDLIDDTSQVSAQLKQNIKAKAGDQQAAGISSDVLTRNATKGSGGVDGSRYSTTAGNGQLSAGELAAARASLEQAADAIGAGAEPAAKANSNARSQEAITLVIDRHKSQLQSLYNRARRSNPSLKGKLVLAITIEPDGSVSAVKVVSSELNDPALESRIVGRVKSFSFGAKDVDRVTVNYPIEFSPF